MSSAAAGVRAGAAEVSLSLSVRGLKKSPTLAIQGRCDELARAGRRIYRLGLGQSPFPVPLPVVEALRANAGRKEYLPVEGLPALRAAIAEYHRKRHGVSCGPDDVLVAPGSKELMFLLQVVYYGELLIPTPAWVSYAPQAQIAGRRTTFLPTTPHGFRLQPADLARVCAEDPDRPRILILNYPGNPTGGTYSSEELAELAEVARRFRIVVLSDEIYGELHHKGRHVSIASFYPEGTILSSGLSKWCGAGGWRLGTFTFPRALRWLLEAIAVAASETYTSTSAPIQYAAVRAFEGGIEMERYLRSARHLLAALTRRCARRLLDAGAQLELPDGAFYLFPDFTPLAPRLARRDVHTSEPLCHRLLADTGVAILPGSVFGRPPGELTARLALVDFDGARALAALEERAEGDPVDDSFLDEHCGVVLQAVDLLSEWVSAQ